MNVPLTKASLYCGAHSQLPLLRMLHVFTRLCPGATTVPSGMVTSLMYRELSHCWALPPVLGAAVVPPVFGIPAVAPVFGTPSVAGGVVLTAGVGEVVACSVASSAVAVE